MSVYLVVRPIDDGHLQVMKEGHGIWMGTKEDATEKAGILNRKIPASDPRWRPLPAAELVKRAPR